MASFLLFPGGKLFDLEQIKSQGHQMMQREGFSYINYWPTSCGQSPGNLVFINNLLPGGGCLGAASGFVPRLRSAFTHYSPLCRVGHTWSFAVQFQFYLFFPRLVRRLGATPKLARWMLLIVLAGVFSRVVGFYKTASCYPHSCERAFLHCELYLIVWLLTTQWKSSSSRFGGTPSPSRVSESSSL